MKDIVIYSGIEPGKKGAGKYVQYFIEQLVRLKVDFEVLSIATPEGKHIELLKKTPFFGWLKKLYYLLNNSFARNNNNKVAKRAIIFHPQSLGINKTKELIINSNEVYLYVFDNFLFCLKSYNHIDNCYSECLDCISNPNAFAKNNCKSFPIKMSAYQYVDFIEFLSSNLDKITFLTQNQNQSKLLRMKFSSKLRLIEIGMNTNEIDFNEPKKDIEIKNSVLYHGTLNYSKGLNYFIDLAKNTSSYDFIIPYAKNATVNYLGFSNFPSNLKFIDCSWDTGLKELCIESKLTIVPSLWSAPIEGALVKSLYYSPNVACVSIANSFANEIPNDCIIKLSADIVKASAILKTCMMNENNLNEKALKWVVDLYNKNELSHSEFIKNHLL